jgi:hypothetical protein
LKLSLNLILAASLLTACGMTDKHVPAHKCQVVVVFDKSNSVSFSDKIPTLEKGLKQSFAVSYTTATKDIQYSRLIINGQTNIFPVPDRFSKPCLYPDPHTRLEQQEFDDWQTEKRRWMKNGVVQIIQLIQSPCTSNSTDVFSIFDGIRQVQKNNGPWDSINVIIFSDMINTTRLINMNTKDITVANASDKGKSICQSLINSKRLTPGETENLFLTIYTPGNMTQTAFVYHFWEGFFKQWGLHEDHYNFQ